MLGSVILVLLGSVINARVRAGNETLSIALVMAFANFILKDTSVVALVVTFAVLPRTINIPMLALIVALIIDSINTPVVVFLDAHPVVMGLVPCLVCRTFDFNTCLFRTVVYAG